MQPRTERPAGRLTVLVVVLTLSVAACSDSGGSTTTTGERLSTAAVPATTAAPSTTAALATTLAPATTVAATTTTVPPTTTVSPTTTVPSQVAARYDPTLIRRDLNCSEEVLEDDGTDEFDDQFVTAHWVVDGVLGWVCFGEEDPTLLTIWELLTTISPPEAFAPLAILAGFDAPDSDTAAFVTPIGDFDGATFQMSMNLSVTDVTDPWFSLTVAHELGHILTGQIEQLDRVSDPAECETFDNGEGCALPGSYLDDWVAEFWSEDELASLDVMVDDPDAADERCSLNPGFLGAYAAISPDEDFAESFAAFVFQVEVDNPHLEDKMAFFDDRAELAEIRDRAEDAGFAGFPNQFDICG